MAQLIDDLNSLRKFLLQAQTQIESLKIIRRVAHRYPFDWVADEHLSKAFSLANACMVLLERLHTDEAFGLSRSLVECSLNLRYITSDLNKLQFRASIFALHSYADKGLWLYWSLRTFKGTQQEEGIRRFASENDYEEDGITAHRSWSRERNFIQLASSLEHPLDPVEDTPEQKSKARVHDYYHPSCFVHCSQPGLNNFFAEQSTFVRISKPSPRIQDFRTRTLFICHRYLHEIVKYSLYGMNVHLPKTFDCLQQHAGDKGFLDLLQR